MYVRAPSGFSQSAHAVTCVGKCRAGEEEEEGEETPRLRHRAGVAAEPTSRRRNKVRASAASAASAAAACDNLPAFFHPAGGRQQLASGSTQSRMRLLLLLQAEGARLGSSQCHACVSRDGPPTVSLNATKRARGSCIVLCGCAEPCHDAYLNRVWE